MRGFVAVILVLVAAMSLTPSVRAVDEANWVKVTFLHVSDLSDISPRKGLGGFAKLKTLIDREKTQSPHTYITFGGDLFSPSVVYHMTEGAYMVDLLNHLGVDFAVPGHHDFDFGLETVPRRFGEARFEWLLANVIDGQNEPAFGLNGSVIIKVEGIKIGIFGITSPKDLRADALDKTVYFKNIVAASRREVARLKKAGADVIVALVHLNFREDFVLASQVRGLDLVLSGYDHVPRMRMVGDTLLAEAGHNAEQLLAVDLLINCSSERGKNRTEVEKSFRLITTRGVEPDSGIEHLVKVYGHSFESGLQETIGITEVDLDTRRNRVRNYESNAGNLIADVMRASTGADVSFINGSGIRGDTHYPAGTKLSRKDVLDILPFHNKIIVMKVLGKNLKLALEHSVSDVEYDARRFLQISGMTMNYDASRSKGARIIYLAINNQPIDDDKFYTLATSNYIAQGGAGYSMFKDAVRVVDVLDARLIATEVIDFIKHKGVIKPVVEGRINSLR